jgi:hypothetical protein
MSPMVVRFSGSLYGHLITLTNCCSVALSINRADREEGKEKARPHCRRLRMTYCQEDQACKEDQARSKENQASSGQRLEAMW